MFLKNHKGFFYGEVFLIFFFVFQFGTIISFSHQACCDEQVLVLGEPFQLKVGGTVAISSENLKVTLKGIPSDSRCPEGVECVWAGQVKVLVHLEKDGQDLGGHTLPFPIFPKSKSPEIVGGYSLQILKVDPYPKSGDKIELSEYQVDLVVKKAAALE
ncbi:MAG: hypothetical protein HYS07_03080 [Chlamydiae bacterium]|nr:hypothetical protein [Chlamydiota bacterium]MBI3277175.1 hypothetical protein [Chlamydiota bacterium]